MAHTFTSRHEIDKHREFFKDDFTSGCDLRIIAADRCVTIPRRVAALEVYLAELVDSDECDVREWKEIMEWAERIIHYGHHCDLRKAAHDIVFECDEAIYQLEEDHACR